MRLRLDLHVHTSFSPDAVIKIEELTPYAKRAGLDGFAVTDHETLEGALKAQESCSSLVVVPGMEIETSNGHLLALNPHRPVGHGLSFVNTVKDIHEAGGLAVLAHPYALMKSGQVYGVASIGGLNAIEVANASSFPYGRSLAKSLALAQKLGLPVTGGSDAHIPQVIGRAYTIIESETKDVESVVDAIRRGRTEAEGSGLTISEWGLKVIKGLVGSL